MRRAKTGDPMPVVRRKKAEQSPFAVDYVDEFKAVRTGRFVRFEGEDVIVEHGDGQLVRVPFDVRVLKKIYPNRRA